MNGCLSRLSSYVPVMDFPCPGCKTASRTVKAGHGHTNDPHNPERNKRIKMMDECPKQVTGISQNTEPAFFINRIRDALL